MDIKTKRENRIRRHKRVRALVKGTSERPRLSVFRAASHIYAQLIDDTRGITMLSVSDIKNVKNKNDLAGKKTVSFEIGEMLGKKALEKGISRVVFDRGGYKYHGRVKALADGARQAGLKF
jgi:large subunit ribosomal protein L18